MREPSSQRLTAVQIVPTSIWSQLRSLREAGLTDREYATILDIVGRLVERERLLLELVDQLQERRAA